MEQAKERDDDGKAHIEHFLYFLDSIKTMAYHWWVWDQLELWSKFRSS